MSSFEKDQILSGYSGAISNTSSTINSLTSQIASASSQVSAGRSIPNDDSTLGFVQNFIKKNISALDLDYSNDVNSQLSNRRLSDRINELSRLFRARENADTAVVETAKAAAKMSAAQVKMNQPRIEDDDEADSAFARLHALIKSEGQRALVAVGSLERAKVAALLGDPKADTSKVGRYKDTSRNPNDNLNEPNDNSNERDDANQAPNGPASVRINNQPTIREDTKALDSRRRKRSIDDVG